YDQGPFDPKEYDYWMPVDSYTGGSEHATMHLIYTRFFHKALRDMGITEGPEPMLHYRNQGMVLGEDSEKMSKSRGNVVAPDDLVKAYGADAVRAYLVFFARWNQGGPWSSTGIDGVSRWLRRVWATILEPAETGNPSGDARKAIRRKLHNTLKGIGRDYEYFEMNTIVSSLMELMNDLTRYKQDGGYGTREWNEAIPIYLTMLAPICPHITEELWMLTGHAYSIHPQSWPKVDESALVMDEMELGVQVNGKLRDHILVPVSLGEDEIKNLALQTEAVLKFVGDKIPRKVIYIPGRLVNIVV
ncbi:MAG: class I tRNA ligase family protein, partial [Anaerolineaceae bacterium]